MSIKSLLSYWSGLQKRERYVVGAGLVGLFLLLFSYFVLLPFFEAKNKLARSIQHQEKVLQEMLSLNEQYRHLKGEGADPRKQTSQSDPDLPMSSRLDKILTETDMKSCVSDFQTTKSGARERHLIRTELKINRVKMDQLIKFLSFVESPGSGMRIEQIFISKTPAETEYLNATVTLKTYEEKLPG
ncbi:MAG: General secretion pathway, M protein [Syntrophus sp. PtaU1.Bin208]|nr:MAG: General secretion pathway, M protein [Syntrophus sp. PtaU1.Bin208]